jgi:hypothetical protein
MTFRSLGLIIAAALAIAPAALAQTAYPFTGSWLPPQQPQPYGYYYAPQLSPGAPSWILSAEGNKLQVQSADGSRATCESLTIQVSGAEPVEVSVDGKQLSVRSVAAAGGSQDSLKGSADRVVRSGPDGAAVTLEGNAKLVIVRRGTRAELVSHRISVNLASGHVEAEITGQPVPTTPAPSTSYPVTPCSPPLPPAVTPATYRGGTDQELPAAPSCPR